MIWKDGKVVYSKAENEVSSRRKRVAKFIAKRKGKDSDELLKDFSIHTRERIASCSKWLSAALVMTFVDEGKLSLEDSIGKFLPVMSQHGKGQIKIWQCLSHLTAIRSAGLKENLAEMKGISSMDEAVGKIALLPMEGQPGKVFRYSNTGLQLAGSVIEKISGRSFENLFRERIAQPCNMSNTDFGNVPVPMPAGGAYSTPADYMNFLVMILNDGLYNGRQVLSKDAVMKMQEDYTAGATVAYSPAEAGSWGYGFGEWVMEKATSNSGAVSSPGLFGSFPWINKEQKYAGFLFAFNLNSKGRNERYRELKSAVEMDIK